MRGIRFAARVIAAVLALAGTTRVAQAQQGDDVQYADEYKLKAAFLFNFGKFVEWPPQILAPADATFRLCIVGRDRFGASLRALEGRMQRGRPIEIVTVRSAADVAGCHLLYGDTNKDFVDAGITPRALGDLPVLTVTSAVEPGQHWVVIRFVQRAGKLRWELNLDTARRANLKISAKLIEIAVVVNGSQGP